MKAKTKSKFRGRSDTYCQSPNNNVCQPARAQRPYTDAKRTRKRTTNPQDAGASQMLPSNSPGSSAHSNPAPGTDAVLFRKLCTDKIRRDYPDVEPRSDYDPITLSGRRFKGSAAEIYTELDRELAIDIEAHGYEFVTRNAKELCDQYVEPTGLKPGELGAGNKFVFVRPIPDSKYSIRLFPGLISATEYCMDFVETATGKAVNSPFEFELWGVPNPDTPWLSFNMCCKLRSIEREHGIKQEDIRPGAEKFILRDGQTCMLLRPGKRSIRFTVPVRKVEAPAAVDDVDVLDLPQFVGP